MIHICAMINCAFDIHVILNIEELNVERENCEGAGERGDQAGEGLAGGVPLPGRGKSCIWQLKNKLCDAFVL